MAARTALVVGAGIGGLTAALSLSRTGIDVTVLERADALREVGAGLQISSNASRVLIDLGLGPALDAVAVVPDRLRIFSSRAGRELNHIDFGAAALPRYGAPYWVIHRADLQAALAEAAGREPRIDLRLGQTITNIRQSGDRVVVDLAGDGALEADLLIGADGVWSMVREQALGLPGAAFTGRAAWRATLPIEDVPAEFRKSSTVWLGAGAHVVHYPVHAGAQFNIVAIVTDTWREQGWSATGDRAELLRRFAAWPSAARNILSLPDSWLKWALCGMPTGRSWSKGRVALLGDAAHAMLPFVAQGAAMAIEDAAVLALTLAESDDIPASLAAYDAARRPRVERVMATARDNDRIYHLDGLTALARDTGLQLLSPERLLARYDWIYSWKAAAGRPQTSRSA